MTDPIQRRLNIRNQLVAQLAGIHRRADRLMEALDMVRTTQIIQGDILVGLEDHAMAVTEPLDRCLAELDRVDRVLVQNGVIKPIPDSPLVPES